MHGRLCNYYYAHMVSERFVRLWRTLFLMWLCLHCHDSVVSREEYVPPKWHRTYWRRLTTVPWQRTWLSLQAMKMLLIIGGVEVNPGPEYLEKRAAKVKYTTWTQDLTTWIFLHAEIEAAANAFAKRVTSLLKLFAQGYLGARQILRHVKTIRD